MDQTQTSHEPGPDEFARASTDHGLHHQGDVADEVHGRDDHGETDGHDDHAHGEVPLGPVDVMAWGALAIGVGAGLIIALCLVITTTLLAGGATL